MIRVHQRQRQADEQTDDLPEHNSALYWASCGKKKTQKCNISRMRKAPALTLT